MLHLDVQLKEGVISQVPGSHFIWDAYSHSTDKPWAAAGTGMVQALLELGISVLQKAIEQRI